MLIVKKGGIKNHFLSLWYDSTCDWTSVCRIFGEHSTHNTYGSVRGIILRKQNIFFQNFFQNWKLCIVYSKNCLKLTKIFVLRLVKMAANITECSRLEQKYGDWEVKFTKEYFVCTEKHVLVKKIFTNGVNNSLPLRTWVEKDCSWCGNTLTFP